MLRTPYDRRGTRPPSYQTHPLRGLPQCPNAWGRRWRAGNWARRGMCHPMQRKRCPKDSHQTSGRQMQTPSKCSRQLGSLTRSCSIFAVQNDPMQRQQAESIHWPYLMLQQRINPVEYPVRGMGTASRRRRLNRTHQRCCITLGRRLQQQARASGQRSPKRCRRPDSRQIGQMQPGLVEKLAHSSLFRHTMRLKVEIGGNLYLTATQLKSCRPQCAAGVLSPEMRQLPPVRMHHDLAISIPFRAQKDDFHRLGCQGCPSDGG
jgi:hypothetical protein